MCRCVPMGAHTNKHWRVSGKGHERLLICLRITIILLTQLFNNRLLTSPGFKHPNMRRIAMRLYNVFALEKCKWLCYLEGLQEYLANAVSQDEGDVGQGARVGSPRHALLLWQRARGGLKG
jgi:hypothetical protein